MVGRLSAFVLSVTLGSSLAVASDPIRAAFGPVPPLSYQTQDGQAAGFTIDVFNEASRREGMRLVWVPAGPSLAIEQALKEGTVDIAPAGMVTPDRRRLFYVSEPWWFAELSLLTRNLHSAGAPDLNGKRLALASPIYRFLAEEHFRGAIQIPFPNAMGAAFELCRGNADAALMIHPDVHEILFARPDVCRDVGVRVTETSATAELAIIARRGHEADARRLRRRIDELALDGTLANMAARHPPIPSSGVVRLAGQLRGRYERRLWRTIAICAFLLLAAGLWFIHRLYRDVRERRRAQAEAQMSQARLTRAHRIAALGDWELDLVTGELDCSTEAREILSLAGPSRLPQGDALLDSVVPEDMDRARAALETAAAGNVINVEYAVSQERGRRYLRQHAEPVRNARNEIVKLVGTVQDVTEYRKLEEQFRQAQKLESLGRLAGGVAHDFNNLLTVINGYTDMLLAQLPESAPARRDAIEIRKAGDRAAALTRQLLIFSRKQPAQLTNIDLNAVVVDAEKMLRRLVGDNVTIKMTLDASIGAVHSDAGQIQQLLTNLVVNARDAMPDGGRIEIETRRANVNAIVAQQQGATAGSYVVLRISDDGCGMDSQTLSRIFEPFFTTKPKEKGTGLGLSTVYSIVKQSNGWVEVSSDPGKGSTFQVYFPQSTQSAEPPVAVEQIPANPRGCEKILVVEDEPGVRRLVTDTLRSNGYRTFEAANGQEALRWAAANPAFDLLVTDVSMPGISGVDLARRIVEEHHGVRILLMSGFIDDFENVSECGFSILQKPFTSAVLMARIRAVLDGTVISGQGNSTP